MALTTEQIDAINTRTLGHQHFARTIEAEVRKQDDELIRQMLETLCLSGGSPLFTAEFDRLLAAITAARARLGEKT